MKNSIKNFAIVIISAAALMLGIVPQAKADNTAISGSASQSTSGAVSGSMASGNDNAQSITFNAPASVDTRTSGTTTLKNVPAITAPALTTTLTETCMGSSSLGGVGAGFGVSIGSTWKDEECIRRLHAREIVAIGEKDVAKEIMCGSPIVAEAYAAVGRPCRVKVSPNTGLGGVVGIERPEPVAQAGG